MTVSPGQFESSFFRLVPRGEVALLQFQRKTLSEEDNVEQFGLDLCRLVDQFGYRRIILSLEGVTWVTSSILGKLIHLHRHLNRNAGEMVLCDIGREIDDVLTTSRLNTYFLISPTTTAALSHWESQS